MRIGHRTTLAGAVFLVSFAVPAANSTETEKPDCLKRFSAVGFPHRLEMVAELSAMRAWTMRSQIKGEAYAMWHNSRGSTVKCEQLERSVYYRCTAVGKPCLPAEAEVGPEDD